MVEYKDITEEDYCNLSYEERYNGAYHVTYEDGSETWEVDGKMHRVDGPAVINNRGEQWYIGSKLLNEQQTHKLKMKIAEDILLNTNPNTLTQKRS